MITIMSPLLLEAVRNSLYDSILKTRGLDRND
jgi:hypothetical protein